MADLRVKATGKPFYKIDGGVAKLLLEMFPEALEQIAAPTFNVQQKANPAAPRWAVQKGKWSDRLEICLTVLNREVHYPGPDCTNPTAEEAEKVFKAAGHQVPAHVLANYAAMLESAKGIDPDVVNESRLRAQNAQFAREDRERGAQRKLAGE